MTSSTQYQMKASQANFGLKLLKAATDANSDVFLSPVSISIALAMTYAGADGQTKQQMKTTLFGDQSDEVIHQNFANLTKWLSEPKDGYQLHSANRLYAQKDYQILQDYIEILAKNYQSEMQSVDFVREGDRVAREINSWVEMITKDRIKNLIPQGVLDAMTRLVLVNAVYFKGDWKEQFNEKFTNKMPFYLGRNKGEKEVDMMHLKKKFPYFEDNNVQVLEMPYEGNRLSMYAFLPKNKDGLEEFEKNLTGEKFLTIMSSTHNAEVIVTFPKFKMEKQFSLSNVLSGMGMAHLFDPAKADLSKVTGNKDLYVSAVIHKAFVEVNEQGSEAAAATAVLMKCRAMPMSPPKIFKFTADHPFLFAIADKENVLFLGRFLA